MTAVYINLHSHLNSSLSLPVGLLAHGFKIECLKGVAPDDGEANRQQGKYRIDCPEHGWKDLIEWLRESGKSLVYSVVATGADGEAEVIEAGELNSGVAQYTTRLGNRRQLFASWFEDCLQTPLTA